MDKPTKPKAWGILAHGLLANARIVMLSGLDRPIDKATSRALHADFFLAKPATSKQVAEILALVKV